MPTKPQYTRGPGQSPAPQPMDQRQRLWSRWGALKAERSSWDSHAKELAQYLLPRSSRFFTTDRNRGGKRHNAIYDNTGLRAVRVLASGMMAGMTSPARPWFKLTIADKDLMAYEPVKVWLSEVTKLLLQVFASGNIYRALHTTYQELGVFGTHATILTDDFDTVLHATSLTWGEYAISADAKGRVDTLYREFDMTVAAMVDEFGWDNVSNTVKSLWNNRNYDAWVPVIHGIEPRRDWQAGDPRAVNMPWRSCYFEQGQENGNRLLRESGFRQFRALTPRWLVTSNDIYGESPGMEALGDTKQLQHEQLRKGQGIDYMTRPPVQAPTSAKGQEVDLLPGGVSYIDSADPKGGIRSTFDVNLRLDYLLADIQDVRGRINAAFYVDLFLMLANMDATGQKMTATEVAERHEEKLLMLGPVLERLTNEMLMPLVDAAFERLAEAGALPLPPPELEGVNTVPEFIGVLAQAQRAVSNNSTDRWVTGLANVASLGRVEVLDHLDVDAYAETSADALGVDPRLLVPDRAVAQIRQARAQAQAEAKQAAQMADAAKGLGDLGRVPTQGGGSNAGADVMQQLMGYGSPTPSAV